MVQFTARFNRQFYYKNLQPALNFDLRIELGEKTYLLKNSFSN